MKRVLVGLNRYELNIGCELNIGLNRYEYYQFFITLFYLISGLKRTASFAVEKKPFQLK